MSGTTWVSRYQKGKTNLDFTEATDSEWQWHQLGHMVWYGMVNVDLYSAIITKVSNALDTLVSGEKPGFQTLSEGLVVLLCAEVVRQRVPDHGAVHSECSASDSG